MGEHVYRWSVNYTLAKVLFSVLGWTAIVGLPGLFVWMASLDKPGRELPVVCGIVGVIVICALVHSRKYWRRFFDRSPQLEFRSGHLRARQLGDEDILWDDIVLIRGQEEQVSRDFSQLVLYTTRGEVELDVAGLDAPMRTIFESAEVMRRLRAEAKRADPRAAPDRGGL